MVLTVQERQALIKAISPNRLQTYTTAAAHTGCDVLDLYVWDRDLAAAAMADVAILEVAMRNAMSIALERLARRPDWYTVDIGLDNRSLKAVAKAWSEVPEARRDPGRVVAQLMFGFWRNLLETGGRRRTPQVHHEIRGPLARGDPRRLPGRTGGGCGSRCPLHA